MELTQFHLFSLLPGEIRNYIWNIAFSSPQIVNITVKNHQITRISIVQQPLLLACRESHGVYLESKKDFIQDKRRKFRVDFDVDIFCIKGLKDFRVWDRKAYLRFRTIALILDRARSIHDMLWELPNLQELWVYTRRPQHVCSTPPSGFRHIWQIHHCVEYPEEYGGNNVFSYEDGKKLCPVCDWRVELEELAYAAAPIQPTSFRLMLPSSVPLFPHRTELYKQAHPVLRWVRIDETSSGSVRENIPSLSKKEAFIASALFYFQKRRRYIVGSEDWIEQLRRQLGNEICKRVE